jgi:hypothetical protein
MLTAIIILRKKKFAKKNIDGRGGNRSTTLHNPNFLFYSASATPRTTPKMAKTAKLKKNTKCKITATIDKRRSLTQFSNVHPLSRRQTSHLSIHKP